MLRTDCETRKREVWAKAQTDSRPTVQGAQLRLALDVETRIQSGREAQTEGQAGPLSCGPVGRPSLSLGLTWPRLTVLRGTDRPGLALRAELLAVSSTVNRDPFLRP